MSDSNRTQAHQQQQQPNGPQMWKPSPRTNLKKWKVQFVFAAAGNPGGEMVVMAADVAMALAMACCQLHTIREPIIQMHIQPAPNDLIVVPQPQPPY